MKKSRKIKPVVEMARHQEQEAAKVLGEALSLLNAATRQLEQLNQYRSEYAAKFNQAGEAGTSVSRMNDFRAFLDKINGAIDKQKQTVASAEENLTQKKVFWFARRGRSKSLDSVLEKYLTEEQVFMEKREQREQDDIAGRPRKE